jgi:hypothetical protein
VTRLSSIIGLIAMLVAGLLLGVTATSRVLDSGSAPGSLRYGPWNVWPKAGAPDADPYSLAVHARRGEAPMTPGEGLAFFASRDAAGDELNGGCSYEIAGVFPQARAWTLTLYRPDGRLLVGPSGRGAFSSAEALVDGTQVRLRLSPQPQPGNWLPLPGKDAIVVALRFYETPLSAVAAALDTARLPGLVKTGCGS